jgi:hypothetical protein
VLKRVHRSQGAADPTTLISKGFPHCLFAGLRVNFLGSHREKFQGESFHKVAFTADPGCRKNPRSERAESKKRPRDLLKDLGVIEGVPCLVNGATKRCGETDFHISQLALPRLIFSLES